jgi:hypothetical protein
MRISNPFRFIFGRSNNSGVKALAIAIAGSLVLATASLGASQVVVDDGEQAINMGDYPRAETLFLSALKTANETNRPTFEVGLGEAILWQGRISDAAKQFKRAQSAVKDNGMLQARLSDDLGYLYQAQGKLDDAIESTKEAVAILKRVNSSNTFPLVFTMYHLAGVTSLKGAQAQAAQILEEALSIEIHANGPSTVNAADINERLAYLYRKLGQTNRAKEKFQAALSFKLATGAVLSPFQPHAYWDNISYSYTDGSPNCTRRFADGREELIVTANGVTVAASLGKTADAKKGVQVNVFIRNDSNGPVEYLPQPPQFVVLEPKIFFAPPLDPTKLADTIEKKGERKAAWIRFWGANATQTLTSTYIGPGGGGFWGGGPYFGGGGYGGGYGAGYGGRGRGWGWGGGGNMSIMNQQIPDYAAQERALQKAADVTNNSRQNADMIRTSVMGPTTVPPGQQTSGALYFDASNVTKASLKLPVGNGTFEFVFPSQ